MREVEMKELEEKKLPEMVSADRLGPLEEAKELDTAMEPHYRTNRLTT